MAREFIIYCDESTKTGRYYSNFYGGALIRSHDLEPIVRELEAKKLALNLNAEVKFQKITQNYVTKYQELLDCFLGMVEQDRIKIRIMFSQNRHVPMNLGAYQREHGYFLLYYQFIKHAFGLRYANESGEPVGIRLLLDQLPDTKEKATRFKNYICSLSDNKQFRDARIFFSPERIGEIRSHEHVVLQCLDVVLGSMQFRLNDHHKDKPEGSKRRSKRTVAKEKVYDHIHDHLRRIVATGFNIGITTGKPEGLISLWKQPYRHWQFIPSDHELDNTRTKK
ncbi:MAG TPA: DUF3800 domain-containing protein [Patescibacteria group bacterium]|nr:DUF3800 domain-containing protein [Patescibacteria group bacterium]